jgi:hypothetical protein
MSQFLISWTSSYSLEILYHFRLWGAMELLFCQWICYCWELSPLKYAIYSTVCWNRCSRGRNRVPLKDGCASKWYSAHVPFLRIYLFCSVHHKIAGSVQFGSSTRQCSSLWQKEWLIAEGRTVPRMLFLHHVQPEIDPIQFAWLFSSLHFARST